MAKITRHGGSLPPRVRARVVADVPVATAYVSNAMLDRYRELVAEFEAAGSTDPAGDALAAASEEPRPAGTIYDQLTAERGEPVA